ncbi:MFS transporter (plasmid) [Rhodococcus globerulus]|uniref:MFS transporter n=1 Tax=Rhodococcus globerulus TaxID=33008 RepID=UPI0039E8DBF1
MPKTPHYPPAGRAPRAVLALAFVALVLEGYDLTMYGTIVPSLLEHPDWNVTPSIAGQIASATVAGMLIGALLAAFLTHRVMRRQLMIASIGLFSAAMGLCAVAGSPAQLGFFRFFVGLGVGVLMPVVAAMIIEFSQPGRRALNVAIGFAGVGIGGCIAGVLGAWIVPDHGFRPMFVLGLLPCLIALPLMQRYLPNSFSQLAERGQRAEAQTLADRYGLLLPDQEEHIGSSRSSLMDIRILFGAGHAVATSMFCLATFLCMMLMYGAAVWLPTMMISAGYGVQSSLAFLLVLNLGATLGALVSSPIADRSGFKPVVVGAFLAAALALWLIAQRPPSVAVIALVALVGLGSMGVQILLNGYIGTHFPVELRGSALGIALGVGRLGGIAGPMYGATLIENYSTSAQFYAWAIPGVIGAVVIALVPWNQADRRRESSAGEEVSQVR